MALRTSLPTNLPNHPTQQLRSGAEIKKLFSEATQSRHISGSGVQPPSAFLAAAAAAPSP